MEQKNYVSLNNLATFADNLKDLYVVKDELETVLSEQNGRIESVETAVASFTEYNRVNVRDYGATGDGVTNDQPAIWAAITAAKALIAQNIPCEIYFPAGTYGILNGGMSIKLPQGKGGLLIRGAGRETTTIKYLDDWQAGGNYGNGWYALDISPEGSPEHWNYDTYIHDVAVTGLTIRDDYPDKHATHTAKGTATAVATGEENHGVNIGYCVRVAVTDCTLINLGDEVVDIYSCEDTIVMNNHVECCPAAGTSGGAITIADGSKGAVVSGNTITRSGEDYVLTADDFDGADGITLPAGVEMSGSVELPDGTVIARYTKLTQDTFIPVGTKIIKENYAVAVESLYTPVSDVVITGNTIRDMHGKAINLGCPNAGSSIDKVIVADNVMSGCDMGINFSGTYPKRGIKIHGNIISDCLGDAILANAVEDITISGNTFRNIAGGFAINTASCSATSRQLISDNVFENIENSVLVSYGSVVVKDCRFDGVGTTDTPLADLRYAIAPYSGDLIVSGCVMKNVCTTGVAGAVSGASLLENTIIEMVGADGNVNDIGLSVNSTHKIVDCTLTGYLIVPYENSIVRGVFLTTGNVAGGSAAINVAGNGSVISDCSIQSVGIAVSVGANNVTVSCCRVTDSLMAINEKNGYNQNMFVNNMLTARYTSQPVGVVGANTIAKNMVNGKWVDNTRATVSETETNLGI